MTSTSDILVSKIIPALRHAEDLALVQELGLDTVIVLKGDIFDIARLSEQARGKTHLLLHLDLIEGVGRDKAGLTYLKQQFGIAGIVSTRSNLIKEARSLNLTAVLRLFALDSAAYTTGIGVLNSVKPSAVEIMPGVAIPFLQPELAHDVHQPIIASGLIKTADTARAMLAAGAAAVSTSNPALWKLRLD